MIKYNLSNLGLFLGILSFLISFPVTITKAQSLKLTSVEPRSAATGIGITLHGLGFDTAADDHTVTFTPVGKNEGIDATPTAIAGGARLRVTVPAGLRGGHHRISITRDSDNDSGILTPLFTVLTENSESVFTRYPPDQLHIGFEVLRI